MDRRTWLARSTAAAAATLVPSSWTLASPVARTAGDPIRLHSNENPLGPSRSAREAMLAAFDAAPYYPSERYALLASAIAEREGVPEDHVVLGAGSHEILRMAGMAFGLGGKNVVLPDPTFEKMGVYAESAGATLHRVPLTDEMETDLDSMAASVDDDTGMVFVCNPNNPTGRIVPADALRNFCARVPVPVFVDEAYHEYVDDARYASMIDLVREGADIVVSRTFSKIFGLAGMRVGYGIARPELARRLVAFRTAHSVAIVSLMAAHASYLDRAFEAQSRASNSEGLQIAYAAFDHQGFRYLEAQSNFVFFRVGEPVKTFASRMLAEGIRVGRPFPPYTDWCRVSIGTPDQMKTFSATLERVAPMIGSTP